MFPNKFAFDTFYLALYCLPKRFKLYFIVYLVNIETLICLLRKIKDVEFSFFDSASYIAKNNYISIYFAKENLGNV